MRRIDLGITVVLFVGACAPNEGDDTSNEVATVNSVDLSGATGLSFVKADGGTRGTIQGAGEGELHKVLDDGSTERLFPEGWLAEEYGVGNTRFLVRLAELHWFEAVDPDDAYPGLWCRFVSFYLDQPVEQPLTCHLPLEVLDACADPDGDPSELGMCWEYPDAYDIGADDTIWALWQADGYNVYAWTRELAVRATPAGVLEAQLQEPFVGFAAVEGGVAINSDSAPRMESYWLDGSDVDLEFLEGAHLFTLSGNRTYTYLGRSLARGTSGDGVYDFSSRAFVPLLDILTFEGGAPAANPVIDVYDGGRLYVRSGSNEPPSRWTTCAGHCC